MEWYHSLTIVFGNLAIILPLWLWSRAESRSDHRHLEGWVKASIEAMREDTKDFHGRLCAIEERRKK